VKALVGVILLAGLAFSGYRWFGDRQVVSAYEKFADAWTRGDKDEMGRHGTADAAKDAFENHNLRGLQSGAAMDALHGTRYAVESKTAAPGGDLKIEATQTIYFDPPGATTGIGGAMWTHIHHSATLRKTAEGWRIVAFEPKYVDMGEVRRR
jgi:hypothetical protein